MHASKSFLSTINFFVLPWCCSLVVFAITETEDYNAFQMSACNVTRLQQRFIELAGLGNVTRLKQFWDTLPPGTIDVNWVDRRPLYNNGSCLNGPLSNYAAIHRAIACDNSSEVLKWLIEKGADVDKAQDAWNGLRPIHYVARWQLNLENLKILIEAGKQKGLNLAASSDLSGESTLSHADLGGREDLVETLTNELGTNITLQQRQMMFGFWASKGRLDKLEALWNQQPRLDLNWKDPRSLLFPFECPNYNSLKNFTPLQRAIACSTKINLVGTVDWLLSKGAAANVSLERYTDDYWLLPIHLAASVLKDVHLVRLFLDGNPELASSMDYDGNSILWHAIAGGSAEIVKLVRQRLTSATLEETHRLFGFWAQIGSVEDMQRLWNNQTNQINIDWIDSHELRCGGKTFGTGFTALHRLLACGNSSNSVSSLQFLTERGADVDYPQDNWLGKRPIHYAVSEQQNLHIVELLLYKGSFKGRERRFSKELLKLWNFPGQKVSQSQDNSGKSALAYAIAGGRADIVEVLVRDLGKSMSIDDAQRLLMFYAIRGNITHLDLFWSKFTSPSLNVNWTEHQSIDYGGCRVQVTELTALQAVLACSNGSQVGAVVKWLLSKGATVKPPNDYAWSPPIHLAVQWQDDFSVIRTLLHAAESVGFDYENSYNSDGKSLAMVASLANLPKLFNRSETFRPLSAVSLLYQISNFSFYYQGLSPLMVAIQSENNPTEMVDSLLDEGLKLGVYEAMINQTMEQDTELYPGDQAGWSAIHWAQYFDRQNIYRRLVGEPEFGFLTCFLKGMTTASIGITNTTEVNTIAMALKTTTNSSSWILGPMKVQTIFFIHLINFIYRL